MAKRGRPRKISNLEELQNKINSYFDNCPDYITISAFNKSTGDFVEYKKYTPTMTGLALHLGFTSRKAMYDYEQNSEFCDTIKNARLRIEHEYEKQLYMDKCTGAIFALKNFGWKDKVENEVTTQTPIIKDDI
ncbi:MAG: DNA-packaging protein [Muribaculaceae bacterium]|nr:DNA-packaging protein [Muribaculaceae bacterium]